VTSRSRVAQLIWALGLGGAEQVVIRLAAALDRKRFDPLIVCLDEPGPFATQAQEAGVEVTHLGKRGPVDVRVIGRLRRLLADREVEVLHTHLWGADFWGRIAGRLAATPTIVTTAHNLDTWKSWYHFAFDRRLARWTTHLVSVSDQVRRFYEEHGVARGRWQVVRNGIDPSSSHPRGRGPELRELGIDDRSPLVGLLGRLVPAKAPERFVEAIAVAREAVPGVRALVIGEGPLRAAVEARVRQLGLENHVILTGVRRDVPKLLAGLDVLAFSSLREGLSIAMLEAMSAGVPVVATRVGGTPELIDSDVNGVLVPPNDPEALGRALIDLLTDPSRAEGLGGAGRDRVKAEFSMERMVETYEALYSSNERSLAGAATA